MTEISILDLQNLRHLISGYSTTHCKMTDYASKKSCRRSEKRKLKKAGSGYFRNIFIKEKMTETSILDLQNLLILSADILPTKFHEKNNQNHYRKRLIPL